MKSFAAVALMLAACSSPRSVSYLHSDSDVRVPYSSDEIAQRTIDALPAKWRAYATLTVYGHSEEGRNLNVVRLAAPQLAPTKAVLMTQAIHGNEFLDIVNHLPEQLVGLASFQRFLASGGALYVVPVVNPDGFTKWQRENANDLDLNRDFPIKHYVDDPEIPAASASAEDKAFTQLVDDTFRAKLDPDWSVPDASRQVRMWRKEDDGKPDLRLFADFHCCQDPETGSLMPPWGDTPSLDDPFGIPTDDVVKYKAWGDVYKSVFPNDFYGTGIQAIGYVAKGTIDELVYERHSDQSITYEGRSGGKEPERLSDHVRMWDAIFSAL